MALSSVKAAPLAKLIGFALLLWGQEINADTNASRLIGRGGTGLLSNDSGQSVQANPAAMLRRSNMRLYLGGAIQKNHTRFSPDTAIAVENLAAPTLSPQIGFYLSIPQSKWQLGVFASQNSQRVSLPVPALDQSADEQHTLFAHRYAGLSYFSRQEQFSLGFARRLGESWGLGLSGTATRAVFRESRNLWAGFSGRDALLDPVRDLRLSLDSGSANFVAVNAGAIYAPLRAPVEFAVALQHQSTTRFDGGKVHLGSGASQSTTEIIQGQSSASITLPTRTRLAFAFQYLPTDSLSLETQVSWERHGKPRNAWAFSTPLEIRDQSSSEAAISSIYSTRQQRSELRLGGAIDYQIETGFLWLHAGYSWHQGSSKPSLASPLSASLAHHNLAFGIEARLEQFSLNLGYMRSIGTCIKVEESESELFVDNPFAPSSPPANLGEHCHASDKLGIGVERSW